MKTIWMLRDADGAPGNPPVEPVEPTEPVAPVESAEPVEPDAEPEPTDVAGFKAAKIAETKRRQAAEAELREKEKTLEYYKGLSEGQKATPKADEPAVKADGPPVPPDPDAYGDDWQGFEKAQSRYNIDVAKYEIKQELKVEQQKTAAQTEAQKRVTAFQSKVAEAAKTDPELPQIIANHHIPGPYYVPMTPVMTDAVLESDIGPQLMRYLKNNPDAAIRLSQSSPVAAIKEIGRIEAELTKKTVVEPPRKISQAPEPPSAVSGGGSMNIDLSNETKEEYIMRRNKEEFGREYK